MRPQLPTADALLPYLRRIDQNRTYSNWGPLNSELQERLCAVFRVPGGSVVTAGSGTDALAGAILAVAGRASRAKPIAIVPAYTFVATAAAAEQCGYRIFLADIESDTWMLDPERLRERLSPKLLEQVGVVIPVCAFGRSVRQRPWIEFRRRSGIQVVIDGAAAIENVLQTPEDLIGKIPVAVSFHATKALAVGEGGCVVSTDTALTTRVARALNFGFLGSRDAAAPGTNGKLSEYHAAVGLAQLDGAFETARGLRCAVVAEYRRCFARENLGHAFYSAPELSSHYALFLASSPEQARRIQAADIDTRLWYGLGMHRHQYFVRTLRESSLANTEDIAPRLVGLPLHGDLGARQVARIVSTVADVVASDA